MHVIVKSLKWTALVIAVLLLCLIAVSHIGARMALDQDYTHSGEVQALPAFSSDTSDGIVRITARGEEFRARIAGFGPADDGSEKPAVILLHGFPVTSAMWNSLIGPLRNAGYRVLAFDQRGYSPGARPNEVASYTATNLSRDVIAVAEAAGLEKFHLIGHDWGAVVGWVTVMRAPQHILSWTGLSIAHPAAFAAAMENDPEQKARSRYFILFITPWLPETLFSFSNFKVLKLMWQGMSEPQREEYLKVFSEPGALTAALNWYRAITVSQDDKAQPAAEVATPTLFIWGNKDPAVGHVAIEDQKQYITGPYREIELDAGHWLLTDKPQDVNTAILEHLANYND